MNWNFSNKKPSDFEMMGMVIATGNPMMDEDVGMCNIHSASSGGV